MRVLAIVVAVVTSACFDGGPCNSGLECASGVCDVGFSQQCRPNECAFGCPSGKVCSTGSAGNLCVPPAQRDAECSGAADDVGGQLTPCAAGLACVIFDRFDQAGVCLPAANRSIDEACSSNDDCTAGLACAGPGVGDLDECEPPAQHG